MGIFDRFKRQKKASGRRALVDYYGAGKPVRPLGSSGGFVGAIQDRLTDDFRGSELSADAAVYASLDKLRARSRQLYMSNPYASRFLQMTTSNVLGQDGIRLEAKTRRTPGGELDPVDNLALEQAWARWSRPQFCSANGKLGLLDVQRVALSTLARDGDVLIRLHHSPDNPFGLEVELLEGDRLLTHHNGLLENGNRITMGVEHDQRGKPIAYHVVRANRIDDPSKVYATGASSTTTTERVPSENIIHLYVAERPGQTRGYPWMAQAMRGLHMTESYRESELVAARVAASKMAFYTSKHGDGYSGDDIDADGNLIFEAEAGLIEQLPEGVELTTLDWSHPNSNMGEFVKSCLRGVAAGLNVSYNALANDLEGVNFSSIRAGVQEEREVWKATQRFLIDHLMQPLFERWLDQALLVGGVPFPARKRDKFLEVVWRPRGFSYVDPVKDQQAYEKAVALGVMSRSEIAAMQGKDFNDILEQIAEEDRKAYELGVNVSPRQTMPIYPAMQDPAAQANGDFGDEGDTESDG